MLADDFPENGSIVGVSAEVTAADAEHGTGSAGNPRQDRIVWIAVEDARGIALIVTLDPATGEEHDTRLGVISALIGILHGCSPELGECNNHGVLPSRLVGVEGEVFPQRIH